MFWKLTSYFILPMGLGLWALLLTGITVLEKIADAVCGVSMAIGPVHFTPPFLFVAISLLSFAYESYELLNAGPKPGEIMTHDKELMGKWRHERNWWIIFFNLVVWLTVWRLGSLLRGLRAKVEGKVK
mmetsp:Transcript_21760/g.49523  ORF Transcript_21760/g.49523 Transcript_21760/m.49523 type:complete len:128 (+) Transcript_21760:73-456(+)